MGLFDTVVIEGLKLKTSAEVSKFLKENGAATPAEYQTKDLDCTLRTYKVDGKGQLWLHAPHETGKRIPYTRPFAGWTDNRSWLERLYFKCKYATLPAAPKTVPEIKHVWQKEKLTNTCEIYTYEEIGGRYVDISYKLEIVDGKVRSIRPGESKIEPVADAQSRKAQNAIWENNMKQNFAKRNAFVSKWYYPVLKQTYNPLVFFTKLIVQNICNKIVQWTHRWHGI